MVADQKISNQAAFILENIHLKKFKFPFIFEISTNEFEEDTNNPEVYLKVFYIKNNPKFKNLIFIFSFLDNANINNRW